MKQKRNGGEQKEPAPFLHRWLLGLDSWLHHVAARMQAKTARYSPQRMKRFLIGFCLLVACGSSYIIIVSVEGRFSNLNITPIHIMPIPKSSLAESVVGGKEGERIQRYKHYLDSLSVVQGRKAFLDSFSAVHPRLMDTLTYLENIYQQQLKTKTYEK